MLIGPHLNYEFHHFLPHLNTSDSLLSLALEWLCYGTCWNFPVEKKTNWNNWKLTKYCWFSNILLKHCWFISMLFSYYTIFTSTRYFIRKPRMECEAFSLAVGCSCMLCEHTISTRTCSNIQLLPGLQTEEKTLTKALIPSLGFQEVCEHHKHTNLFAAVLGQTVNNSIHPVNRRTCRLSIAKSN